MKEDAQILLQGMENTLQERVTMLALGVGGGGANMVGNLQRRKPEGVLFRVADTDEQALRGCSVEGQILLGRGTTRGLSTGGDIELGAKVAENDLAELKRLIETADILFLFVGMGGGTGSGAAPIIARLAAEMNVMVISLVSLPFTCEGKHRREIAEKGSGALRKYSHLLLPMANDLLLQEADPEETLVRTLQIGDDWMGAAVMAFWRSLYWRGLFNVDLGSLQKTFRKVGGKSLFGFGLGEGEDAAREALRQLVACPLLRSTEFAAQADRLLIHIVGGPDLRTRDVKLLADEIRHKFGRSAEITLGAVQRPEFQEMVEVCVLGATDVDARRSSSWQSNGDSRPQAIGGRILPSSGATEADDKVIMSANSPESGIQREFPFTSEKKGHFDKTDANEFGGEDLDTPTFLRRGIKIKV
ncbi:MAG: cell division FtsZ family protein [Opitutales bacterium]|nr:cell division FtsZ family protein [Opitutales bacterium]MCH8539950.1 cell division FtsZ family protein [Opitutales bacterium]